MIKADDIRHLRTASPDYAETEALKGEFRKHRAERVPFWLDAADFDRVFHWKLRGQYGRQVAKRAQNGDAAYRIVTEATFRITGPTLDYEAVVRLGLLAALPGVGVPVASAVLALTEPDRYCVIDFRAWRALFRDKRTGFAIPDYLRYRVEVARLAADLGWLVQETDLALWEYDRRRHADSV
jgi:hypothetical protein